MATTITERSGPLAASDAAASNRFGEAVALNAAGTVLVVGTNVGTFYTYDLSSGSWVQRGSKVSTGVSATCAVALSADGTVLAVGNRGYGGSNYGGVFIYDFSGGSWVQRGSVLQASPLASELFGSSVALSSDGTILAVGCRAAAAGGTNRGRVLVYDYAAGWTLRGEITPADATNGDFFGEGVALSADGAVLAVVSQLWLAGSTYRGGVYVFDYAAGWTQRGTPIQANWEDNTQTNSVAITGDGARIYIGLVQADWNFNDGLLSLWRWNGSAFVFDREIGAAAGAADDYLGIGVAVSSTGELLVTGASKWEGTYTDQGGVYTFDVVYGAVLVGALSGSASLAGLFSNTMLNDLLDFAGAADSSAGTFLNVYRATSDTAAMTNAVAIAFGPLVADTVDSSDALESTVFVMYTEAIGLTDALASTSNTTAALTDSATMRDTIQQAINQIVADSADGTDSLSLGAALALVDIADAVATQTSTYNSVMLVAELIATLEAYNGADAYDITESGDLSDAYVARVDALVALIEAAQAVDTNTALIHVMQLAGDSADAVVEISSAGSLLNALLGDSALATVRINIGGELFTGWVLNTDTMAPSEYQFADRQFNSACKFGTRYLMAADDGIYEFTDAVGVESVMTYIKTGKTDFGSDLKKRIVNSYMVYSASGQMVLKVTTSEFGNLVTRNYRMTPQANDTTDARRIDIGKGVTSRYWQFEVVGDGVDCDIDEIGMLPIVLSRRI